MACRSASVRACFSSPTVTGGALGSEYRLDALGSKYRGVGALGRWDDGALGRWVRFGVRSGEGVGSQLVTLGYLPPSVDAALDAADRTGRLGQAACGGRLSCVDGVDVGVGDSSARATLTCTCLNRTCSARSASGWNGPRHRILTRQAAVSSSPSSSSIGASVSHVMLECRHGRYPGVLS